VRLQDIHDAINRHQEEISVNYIHQPAVMSVTYLGTKEEVGGINYRIAESFAGGIIHEESV
jgi:hypothetical protein